MRRNAGLFAGLSLAGVLSLAVLSVAQPQKTAPGPTFSARAELVLVPVHVQRHGEHVASLKRDAFTVLQDGKPQKVAVFDEIRTTTKRLQRVAVPEGEFTNELEGDANAARYTVIAVDRINTNAIDMQRLRQGLLTFLKQATDSGEPIRLVAINLSSIQVVQDFTTDPKVLADALQRMGTPAGKTQPESDQGPVSENQGEMAGLIAMLESKGQSAAGVRKALEASKNSTDEVTDFQDRTGRINSLEALQQIAISLSGFPGRKSVVWASSGYPFNGVPSEIARLGAFDSWRGGNNFSHASEAMGLDEYTTHLLSTGNVAVYPVDVRGMVNVAYQAMNPNSAYAGSREQYQARNEDVTTTFVRLAEGTGGKPCYGREDVSGCFKEALDDERDYYIVGYYLDRSATQPGWHRINVKVSEPGVSVRSRTGFLVESFSPDQTKAMDVKLELASRLQGIGIPFRGRWSAVSPKGDKKAVTLELRLAPEAKLVASDQPHLNLEVAALARKPDGTVGGQFGEHVERNLPPEALSQIEQHGLTYRNTLALAPGNYQVRIVVRDNNTGRMGSLWAPLKVE